MDVMRALINFGDKLLKFFNLKLLKRKSYESKIQEFNLLEQEFNLLEKDKENVDKELLQITDKFNKKLMEEKEKNNKIMEENTKNIILNKKIEIFSHQIEKLKSFQKYQKDHFKILLLKYFDKLENIDHEILEKSHAQLCQDIIYILEFGKKNDGFFIEIGASDGLLNSNTYMFEKLMNWNGLLIESNKELIEKLKKNRPNSKIIEAFVSGKEIKGYTYFKAKNFPEINGIEKKLGFESFYDDREEVYSTNIKDIIANNNVPKKVNFMSIDIEGLEVEILENIEFEKYTFDMICVEHNFDVTKARSIDKILKQNNYVKKYENFSKWDYFYFKKRVTE